MKSVFLIAIVAVAMIGVLVPSVFAEDKDSEKLFPHYFTNSEDTENVIVNNRGPHVGTASLQNVEVIDKEHYNLIKTSVKIKVNVGLQEFVKINHKAIVIVSEKGSYTAEILPECKSPRDYNGLRDTDNFHVSGKMGGEFIIESCFSVEKHYEKFDIYYGNMGTQTTIEYLEKKRDPAQIYHMDSFSLNDSNLIPADIFSDLTATIISESSKVISEYSKDSDIAIKQNIESVKDISDKKLVCPTSANGERGERIKGGYVMESLPGIYDNIIVLDFKSLYPSIVKTFNIDPSSYHEKEQKGDIESPNKAHFANEDGILPNIIQELWIEREKSRKSKNELSRYAIKILMNSFFGVLANPSCRFYNINLANAITNFGQDLIKKTAEQIEERGYKVIYSDTDSVFIDTKLDSYKQSEKIGKELERSVNEFHDKRIKRKYKRESSLELEYEKCYSRFLMPKLRGKETGAKKRYAGLIIKDGKEEVQFVGLETVRSDWTNAAKNFQKKLYDKIFHKEDPTPFIKKYVEEILSGNQDKNLVYRKSIRKDLKEYTKITPQHIRAARKLKKLESNIIEYYITTDGPEPIQILKHDIDYDHYIKKQIKPIADSILQFFDIDFEEIISGNKQTTLFGFS